MEREEIERLVQKFEAQNPQTKEPETVEVKNENVAVVIADEKHAIVERTTSTAMGNFGSVVGGVQQDILNKAKEKISSEKLTDKHAENLAKIADKALVVDAEKASLRVEEQEADNKVRKQEIRNRLIVLKAEAIRLQKEQEQLNKEQKADHKKRNKDAKWELYKDKLTKMKYSYVPCGFVLAMLLFFDGVRSFFDGINTVSTAIVKALKWVVIFGVLSAVIYSVPILREWATKILTGGL